MGDVESKTIEKWSDLVNLLDRLTRDNTISWDESSERESFITDVGDDVIKIARLSSGSESGHDLIVITIYDDLGNLIESFTDEDLPTGYISSPYAFMLKLHKAIARKVRGADQALERIIKTLKDKDQEIPF